MKFILLSLVLVSTCPKLNAQKTTDKNESFLQSIERGALIYEDFCVTCHLPDGKGVEKMIPPLAKSDYLMGNRTASIKAIKFGQQGEIIVNGITYNSVMAPLGLTDEEIADVMNYITTSWGNENDKMINISEVSKIEE